MEDSAIIALYWARDEEAIAASDQKYGPLCRGISLRILTDPQDAEECVNDTWGRAWRSMPPQRPNSLRAYLAKIVRALSIDRWRADRARKRGGGLAELAMELEDSLPPSRSAEEETEIRELTGALDRWLDTLDQEERALFLLRYWYGESVNEIARRWSCPSNRLSQRLRRLRLRLKDWLEQEGIFV